MIRTLLLGFLGTLLYSCHDGVPVNKSELKEIYSELRVGDSLKVKYYLIDSIENFNTKSITETDTAYKIADYGTGEAGLWSEELFDSIEIISNKSLRIKANSFGITPVHYKFSLPYFSKDKSSFLIYYSLYCGTLCAESSLRLYRKINGKWTFIKTYFSMVS